jgi:hypothetical protein
MEAIFRLARTGAHWRRFRRVLESGTASMCVSTAGFGMAPKVGEVMAALVLEGDETGIPEELRVATVLANQP